MYEKKPKELAGEAVKNISTVRDHYWYVKDAFAGFYPVIFQKNVFQKTFQ